MAMNMLEYSADEMFYDKDWASLLQNWICDLAMALEGSPRWQQWDTQCQQQMLKGRSLAAFLD